MKFRFKTIPLLFFLLSFLIFPTAATSGQTTWDIRVNTINTVETPDHMILKVYFNIFDPGTGKAVTDAELSNAQVTLLNTNLSAAGELKEPDVPIYVALVLDSSGSMAGSADILKNAAKLAVSNTPNNSFFSIVQFDEEIKLLQDFTENIAALSYAIDQIKISNRGTCLYDAAYSAVEAMAKAPAGRRAVILFTDGKDETKEGKACSKHSYQELVDLAMKGQVPIHTIGLSANAASINTFELQSMAASTGAFSAIGNQSNLEKSFAEIMNALKAQWMVESLIYPRSGENNAVLSLNISDQESLNTAFVVESKADYAGPPSPVQAQLDGLFFIPQNQSYDLQLSLTSPELVEYIKISLWDQKGGSKAAEFIFNDPVDFNTFNIPSDQLTIGREYEIRIIAVSRTDKMPFAIVRSEDGKTSSEIVHTFTFDPSAVLPQVKIQSVVPDGNDLTVNIETTNSSLVNGFDGWLVDEETKTLVKNSNFSQEKFSGNSGSILLPLEENKVPDGQYTLVVRALGSENQVYSSQQYEGIVYSATRPSFFQKITRALIASPIYLFAIIGIILAVVVFFMVTNMREKSLSGTPVMQGRLGGKAKRKKGSQQVSALASDEPIAGRSVSPVAVHPIPQQVKPTPVKATPPPKPKSSSTASPNLVDQTLVGPAANLDATMVAYNAPALPVLTFNQAIPGYGTRITIEQLPFTIGRKDTSLVLNDISVSRQHGQITYNQAAETYQYTDLNSSNGSLFNGQKLLAGQPITLNPGSRIQVGNVVEFIFSYQ